MSAFNTVLVPWKDPTSGQRRELKVQFKYGDTWQHVYRIGDVLKWGGNDVGIRAVKRVVVDGVLDDLAPSSTTPEDFEVHIVENKIADVRPATGEYNFVGLESPYIVLEY